MDFKISSINIHTPLVLKKNGLIDHHYKYIAVYFTFQKMVGNVYFKLYKPS